MSNPARQRSRVAGAAGPVDDTPAGDPGNSGQRFGVGLDLLAAALRLPGRALGARLGAGLGSLAAMCLRDRRRVALSQLEFALPELSAARHRSIWRESLRHQGRSLVELAGLAGSPARRAAVLADVEVTGQDHFDQARAWAGPGRGFIVVTAHLGNWELCLAAMAARGHPISVVHHGLDRPGLSGWLGRVRTRSGDVELIELGQVRAGQLLSALSKGRVLVAAMDQNANLDEGEFASFFGAPACTRRGPVVLAFRLGVPLLPVFSHRVGGGPQHQVEFLPPIELNSTERGSEALERAIEDGLTRVNRVIESLIRATPEQWIWSHRRFKTRPGPGEAIGFERDSPTLPSRRRRRR